MANRQAAEIREPVCAKSQTSPLDVPLTEPSIMRANSSSAKGILLVTLVARFQRFQVRTNRAFPGPLAIQQKQKKERTVPSRLPLARRHDRSKLLLPEPCYARFHADGWIFL
jgi:hypothetical protein